jgi:predicted O-methyltransferase YrrM
MTNHVLPDQLPAILAEAERRGFKLSSEPLTGALLRVLAASKPGGQLLEIGTGMGVGTSWLLDGMDIASTLVTVELDHTVSAVARQHLGSDPRVTFVTADAEPFLLQLRAGFDLIFADTFPGKFYLLDETLARLKIGGLYVVDDLLPQPTWPPEHEANVNRLVAELSARADLRTVQLDWASGIMVCTKIAAS